MTEIDDSFIDKDMISAAGTRTPVFAKFNNEFNDLYDFFSGRDAPGRDNFWWFSLVHSTPFQLDGPKAMCFISETL
jgi:hypothetical protein